MKSTKKAILTAAAAVFGLALSVPALAGGKHDHHRDHHRHWDRGHHHHPHGHRHVVRERVVVHRPVYVAPHYAPVHPGYYVAAPRHPGIVVRVDLPPLVIP